jgi:hypothetical protein
LLYTEKTANAAFSFKKIDSLFGIDVIPSVAL